METVREQNIVVDEEDDTPMLSSQALEALREFLSEQNRSIVADNEGGTAGEEEEVALVMEDWRLSQFWYDRETAETVAREVIALSSSVDSPSVACIACPTLYAYLKIKFCISRLMESSAKEYAAFEEKVERTLYLDNLAPHPQVTNTVLESAFNQFGTVKSVQLIPSYLKFCIINAALVEMESKQKAESILSDMIDSPFMISGMPRPVRVRKARIEMFDDRPKKPGRRIVCHWMDPNDPNFKRVKQIKDLTKKHASEASFLFEQQLAAEEKLHDQQTESLKTNYKKFELIDNAQADGVVRRLAGHYGMRINDT